MNVNVNVNAQTEKEISRLIELGYRREDIQILPDGQLTIVQHDEGKSSALVIAKATAADRLKTMIERKLELDYLATSLTVAGQEVPAEVEAEYLKLKADIDTTMLLIKE